ncbi:MAG: hypothetical protein ACFBZ9_01055 [Sphingomonadales bacterium]
MSVITKLLFVSIISFALGSCGFASDPETEALADGYLGEMATVADALESIESPEDVEAAAATIQAAADKLQAITEGLEDELTGMGAMRVLGAKAGEFMEVQQRIGEAMTRLNEKDPEWMEKIATAMDTLPDS